MSRMLGCCIKKDIREILRTGKVILFAALAFGIAVMILGITMIFTDIPDVLTAQLRDFNIGSLEEVIGAMYPKLVRESLGIFSYYIGIFYSLVTVIVTHRILKAEQTEGKWILPLEQGFSMQGFVFSKCIVYGLMTGLSVFAAYLFYFFVAGMMMERNMPFSNAFFLALVHGLNLFFITAYTLLLSVLYPNPVLAAISVIATVLFLPDMAVYFSFGKYLPTYLLTFVYESGSEAGQIMPALVLNVGLLVILGLLTCIKSGNES